MPSLLSSSICRIEHPSSFRTMLQSPRTLPPSQRQSSSSSSLTCKNRDKTLLSRIVLFLILSLSWWAVPSKAFCPSTKTAIGAQRSSRFLGQGFRLVKPSNQRKKTTTTTSSSLHMFLGTNEGLLGVGTPEVFTILLVGYFVLGPNELYKLVKEIGVFVQNFRSLGTEAAASFTNSMESSLELQEIRKAQRELNDAFTFRRTINVEEDENDDPFSVTVDSERRGTNPESNVYKGVKGEKASTAAAPKKKLKKKMKKRRKEPTTEQALDDMELSSTSSPPINMDKPLPNDFPPPMDESWPGPTMDSNEMDLYPDLDMPSSPEPVDTDTLRQERMDRLTAAATQKDDTMNDSATATSIPDGAVATAEQDRFAAQLSGNWNQQILDKQEMLDPMARIMEKIALLEEEKQAADSRLEEEFAMRAELEEKYYRKKKALLEEAVTEVQQEAFGGGSSDGASGGTS